MDLDVGQVIKRRPAAELELFALGRGADRPARRRHGPVVRAVPGLRQGRDRDGAGWRGSRRAGGRTTRGPRPARACGRRAGHRSPAWAIGWQWRSAQPQSGGWYGGGRSSRSRIQSTRRRCVPSSSTLSRIFAWAPMSVAPRLPTIGQTCSRRGSVPVGLARRTATNPSASGLSSARSPGCALSHFSATRSSSIAPASGLPPIRKASQGASIGKRSDSRTPGPGRRRRIRMVAVLPDRVRDMPVVAAERHHRPAVDPDVLGHDRGCRDRLAGEGRARDAPPALEPVLEAAVDDHRPHPPRRARAYAGRAAGDEVAHTTVGAVSARRSRP